MCFIKWDIDLYSLEITDTQSQAMRERYNVDSDESENCSKQPKWDCDFGGTYFSILNMQLAHQYWTGYKPSVYFRPHEVWEIKGAE